MISGVGLGFREEIEEELLNVDLPKLVELAPENWMRMGRALKKSPLRYRATRYPILCQFMDLLNKDDR